MTLAETESSRALAAGPQLVLDGVAVGEGGVKAVENMRCHLPTFAFNSSRKFNTTVS